MATSGTTLFSPATSDLTLNAFSRCGKSGAVLTTEHLERAAEEANFVQIEWANRGYNLWKGETIQIPAAATLTQGLGQYPVPASTLTIVLAYIQTGTGQATTNRVMGPLSAVEFAAIPNPLKQGPPTSFWYDRQTSPLLNLWPVPDSGGPYTAFVRCFTQIQDAVMPGGLNLDQPYRFLDAFTAALAIRLAMHFAPERLGQPGNPARGVPGTGLYGAYEKAWEYATTADTEFVPVTIMGDMSGYFRL